LRKQHSRCIFGYGGVGKTALVVETIKQILQDIIDNKTTNDYKPEYIFFFSAKKRKLQVSDATGRIIEKEIPSHFETADELLSMYYPSWMDIFKPLPEK
jgi:GTPase SAR1 family protein